MWNINIKANELIWHDKYNSYTFKKEILWLLGKEKGKTGGIVYLNDG